MRVFIDDLNLIRVETKEYIHQISLDNETLSYVETKNDVQYFKTKHVITLNKADKILINNKMYKLEIGHVTLTKAFEKRYRYDGFLGNKYHSEYTEFAFYSPVVKEAYVEIDEKLYEMTYENAAWYVKVFGNFDKSKYRYKVRLVDTFDYVIDPYAKAGDNTYSIIIDLNKVNKSQSSFLTFKRSEEAIIYEGHIRDLTVNLDVKDKKNYLGLINYANALNMSVIEYIKSLGMTHLQLLPIQDFIGVLDDEKDAMYNWGYNPQQYFVLEGWYSNGYLDPYKRINEFKQVVDFAHKNKLGINVDVVYNHVYERGMFPYDLLVPGYFYRHDDTFKATNSSYVGNDIETTNYMVRRLIVDSLVYLTETFKIDGYRFDLMGLLDIATMKQIQERLLKINPNILLYGEGWNMDNAIENSKRSHMFNNKKFPYYGHFNDKFRNIIKGELNSGKKGYGTGLPVNKEVVDVLLGTKTLFKDYRQTINYVECHDNHTLYDQMLISGVNKADLMIYQDFINHVIAVSKGIIFYHAGQEMYRSKDLVENSYNASDSINGLKWNITKSIKNFKKIIKIRKQYINNVDSVKAMIKDNMIKYQIIKTDKQITTYIKNDFNENIVTVEGNKLFNSQKVTKITNKKYLLTKPGVYIWINET